ncbi:hypothetical protein QFZ66_000125 [Streptomyces sp. B4I13]|nr:hypothetical protein [Streptomyces sp. B4I13]
MVERGIIVSYETIRRRCAKFGQAYTNGLRRRRWEITSTGYRCPLRDSGPTPTNSPLRHINQKIIPPGQPT